MKKSFTLAVAMFLYANAAFAEELTLDESIRLALFNSERIDASEATKESSRHELSAQRRAAGLKIAWNSRATKIGGAYYRSGRSLFNPGSYSVSEDKYVSSGDPYKSEFSNSFTAQFPLYSGGLIEGRIKFAGFQSAAADLNLERTRQQVRFQTEQAYYNLLQRQNLLGVAENAVKTAQAQLKLINIQYEEGALPKADVLQMEVQLAAYNQELVTAKGERDVAVYQLSKLIGREGEDIVLKDKLTYEPFPYTLAEAETFAMANRPDRVAATFGVNRAKAGVTVAQAGYKPSVNAVYSRNIADNRPFMRDGRNETWSFGVDANWNVFDNFITTANVDAAKANVENAKATETNIKKTLILETRSAYAQMKAAEINIKASEIAAKQAKESYEIASVRYDEGVDNLLAVTTAQERLTRAETNYFTALYNYNLYRAQLEQAVGFPVALDVPSYEKNINNSPGSAKHLDKIAEKSKIDPENVR